MFIKVLQQIDAENNIYYVQLVSPMNETAQIASSEYPLTEGHTYRAIPNVHWVGESKEDCALAHFRVNGKQKSMEQSV